MASTLPASTSSSEPSRPWPYSEIRAGWRLAPSVGMMHSNCAVATLPGIWVGQGVELARAVVEAGGGGWAAHLQVAREPGRCRGPVVMPGLLWSGGSTVVSFELRRPPWTFTSARLWSPSWAKALLRIASSRERQVLARGDREVPGLVQVPARDPGPLQGLEDARVAGPLRPLVAGQLAVVAQPLEPGRRGDDIAARGAEVAQGDDVRVPVGEILARVDQQVGVLR